MEGPNESIDISGAFSDFESLDSPKLIAVSCDFGSSYEDFLGFTSS